jgi:leucyl aminopeptidase
MLYKSQNNNFRFDPLLSLQVKSADNQDINFISDSNHINLEVCDLFSPDTATVSIRANRRIQIKEMAAQAAKTIKERAIDQFKPGMSQRVFALDISEFLANAGDDCLSDICEGIILGLFTAERHSREPEVIVKLDIRLQVDRRSDAELSALSRTLIESTELARSIISARNLVNKPGNLLRPADLAQEIISWFDGCDRVHIELMDYNDLVERGFHALLAVGGSSSFKPMCLVLEYRGNPESPLSTALIGKGVTCDTGGYCLKPASSMTGIKGDMAGAAAVAGAMKALAANNIHTNVSAVIPICENRISSDAMLPGDVIDTFAGIKVEIVNTDAEGRLILADAVAYAASKLKPSRVIDVATLTGAVVNMLGFTIGGAICDDNNLYKQLLGAQELSGEQHWLLPAYREHEVMIESDLADIKNLGDQHCGTITAGLFIRRFTQGVPWLHLDIAGTAWVDKPIFEFQSKGATGAAVSTLYYLCRENN